MSFLLPLAPRSRRVPWFTKHGRMWQVWEPEMNPQGSAETGKDHPQKQKEVAIHTALHSFQGHPSARMKGEQTGSPHRTLCSAPWHLDPCTFSVWPQLLLGWQGSHHLFQSLKKTDVAPPVRSRRSHRLWSSVTVQGAGRSQSQQFESRFHMVPSLCPVWNLLPNPMKSHYSHTHVYTCTPT